MKSESTFEVIAENVSIMRTYYTRVKWFTEMLLFQHRVAPYPFHVFLSTFHATYTISFKIQNLIFNF
jgi:hypothetical protein